LLTDVESGKLREVGCCIAATAYIADVNFIAKLVPKDRCLPVDEWITNATPEPML
jgi:hypothetical protein